jgi:hypothetical protein
VARSRLVRGGSHEGHVEVSVAFNNTAQLPAGERAKEHRSRPGQDGEGVGLGATGPI